MFIMVEFDMSNVGMIHYFIDLKVKWYVDGIFISQKKYVQDIQDRFQMKNCNFVSILMEKGFKFIKELKGRNSGEFRVKKQGTGIHGLFVKLDILYIHLLKFV